MTENLVYEKDVIIELALNVVKASIPSERDLFEIYSNDIYDSLNNNKASIDVRNINKFGPEESLVSYFVLAFIAAAAKDLSKEGIILAKKSLKHWLDSNKNRLDESINNKIARDAIDILKKYLA